MKKAIVLLIGLFFLTSCVCLYDSYKDSIKEFNVKTAVKEMYLDPQNNMFVFVVGYYLPGNKEECVNTLYIQVYSQNLIKWLLDKKFSIRLKLQLNKYAWDLTIFPSIWQFWKKINIQIHPMEKFDKNVHTAWRI